MGRVISTAIQFIDGFTKPSKEVINSMRSMGNEAIKAGKQIQSAGKTITSVGVKMSLLPTYIEDDEELEQQEESQTPKEYEIDFKTGQLTGNIVEGLEAIKIWIWLVLQTPRYRYYVYTWDYGNEFEDLIGQGYTEEYIEAETQRMTEDCLSVNENIQGISDFSVSMENDVLTVSFVVNTIYGDIEFKDQQIAKPTAA